jgi:hypothetical protein
MTRVALGALTVIAVAGVAASATAAPSSSPLARHLTFILQPQDLQFFSNTGPISGFPTSPLVPGDRVIGQDRILQAGQRAGHDDEVCTVAFTRDVLCQDIWILNGRGDVQASWTLRWPATGDSGPGSFNGVIDGGTGWFRAVHGSFRATALTGGRLRITAVISGNG